MAMLSVVCLKSEFHGNSNIQNTSKKLLAFQRYSGARS
jgi:hypothetical protein